MTLIAAALAFAIAFLILRKQGGALRHVLAFAVAAFAAALLASFAFHEMFPYGHPSRSRLVVPHMAAGAAAAILGPLLGMLAALLMRRRAQA